MSLRTRLEALVSAIGADIKALQFADVNLRWAPAVVAWGANVNISAPVFTGLPFSLQSGDRVLLYGQTQGYQNGLYKYQGSGVTMVRADDANAEWHYSKGKLVYASYPGGFFQYTGAIPIAVGTTPQSFMAVTGHDVALELDTVDARLDAIERSVAEPCFAVYTSNQVLTNEFISSNIFPGDRVLLVGQTVKADNGVYTPTADTGSGSFLTRDPDEIYWAGKLFPVVSKLKVGLDDDYSSPVIYSCTDYKGTDNYAFTQVSAPAAAATVAASGDRVISVNGQTTITIAGLDGDQDVAYEILIVGTRAAGGGSALVLKPNGLTSTTHSMYHQAATEPGVSAPSHSVNDVSANIGMCIGVAWVATSKNAWVVQGRLQAKTGQGDRLWNGTSSSNKDATTGHLNMVHSARWADSTTKITSLVLDFGNTFTGDVVLRTISSSRSSNANTSSAKLRPNGAQNFTAGAWAKVAFATVEHDNANMAVLASNRLVAKQPGFYLIEGSIQPNSGGSTNRYFALTKNHSQVAANTDTFTIKRDNRDNTDNSTGTMRVVDVVWMNTDDFVELWFTSTLASAIAGSPLNSAFSLTRLPSGADVAAPGPWQPINAAGGAQPAFQNGWVSFDTTVFGPVQYRRDISGKVHFRGTVKSGANDSTLFTMPPGFRPTIVQDFMVKGGTGSTAQVNLIRVNKDGTVTQTQRNGGVNDAVALDAISYYTD